MVAPRPATPAPELWSRLVHVIWTTSFSMSSARPFSRGSAIIVILFLVRKEMSQEVGEWDEQKGHS